LEWVGNRQDEELLHLMSYLNECAKAEDVREFNREKLRLVELNNTNLGEMVQLH